LNAHRSDPQNYAPVAQGDSSSFGALIREHRVAAGFTQEELAERAGISARSVSDLERGLYQAPHRDTVARLAAALGLSAEAAAQLEAVVVRQRGPSTLPQQLEPEAPALPTGNRHVPGCELVRARAL
jgi:transcriptional regulator with XRE-family HTH domain